MDSLPIELILIIFNQLIKDTIAEFVKSSTNLWLTQCDTSTEHINLVKQTQCSLMNYAQINKTFRDASAIWATYASNKIKHQVPKWALKLETDYTYSQLIRALTTFIYWLPDVWCHDITNASMCLDYMEKTKQTTLHDINGVCEIFKALDFEYYQPAQIAQFECPRWRAYKSFDTEKDLLPFAQRMVPLNEFNIRTYLINHQEDSIDTSILDIDTVHSLIPHGKLKTQPFLSYFQINEWELTMIMVQLNHNEHLDLDPDPDQDQDQVRLHFLEYGLRIHRPLFGQFHVFHRTKQYLSYKL